MTLTFAPGVNGGYVADNWGADWVAGQDRLLKLARNHGQETGRGEVLRPIHQGRDIHMRKISTAIAGSVLAAGVAAGLFGAGTASAAPGAEVSVGGHQVGIGDRTEAGAQARSTHGNVAVAISTFVPSRANANGTGKGNVALAADSGPDSGPDGAPTYFGANVHESGNNNLVIASPLSGAHVVHGDRNIVASSLGVSGQVSGDDNRIFSVGSNVGALTDKEANSRTVVAVCGASIVSAQGASIASNC